MRCPGIRCSSNSRGSLAVLLAALLTACGAPGGRRGLESGPTSGSSGGGEGTERGLEIEAAQPARLTKTTEGLEKARKRYARRIALTIGVDAYQAPIPALRFAVSDARRTAELFRSMGFDQVESIENEGATRKGILEAIEQKLPKIAGKNDLVVVFFAGHGITVGDMGYVLPQDGTKDVVKTGVSVRELKDLALRLESPHVLYLVDACFSGSMLRRATGSSANTQAYWDAVSAGRVVQVITAGGPDETVLEIGGWGSFTKSMHAALGGAADADGDAVVTVEELGAYVEKGVPSDTKDKQHPQWGWLDGTSMITMFDARRVPAEADDGKLVRLLVPGYETELGALYATADGGDLKKAETQVRDLMMNRPHAALHLVLAEIYLRRDALGNASLVDAELTRAKDLPRTPDLDKRMFDLRAWLERVRRQSQ